MFRNNIEAMDPYLPGEQPQGGKFIKLNTNENPYPCSPRVQQAIEHTSRHGLGRYPDPDASAFRRRAGEALGIDPDWILCGNGSDDLLTIVTRALVDSGQRVRSPTPSYVLYKTLAQIQGAHLEQIPFQKDWSLSDDFVAPADNLKLAYLANPNSPSGTMIPPAQVLEMAKRLPCPLLVDEAYVDFADGNCLELVAQLDRIMVTRSMSKSYAVAGLRFGFLLAQPHVIQQLIKVKDSYNCGALAIAGATAAIDDQQWRVDHCEKIRTTRERLTVGMKSLGFDPVPSQANFVWNPHPDLPLRPLYEQLKQARVLVRYMDYPDWGDGLRVSVGTDPQIDAFLDLLKAMV